MVGPEVSFSFRSRVSRTLLSCSAALTSFSDDLDPVTAMYLLCTPDGRPISFELLPVADHGLIPFYELSVDLTPGSMSAIRFNRALFVIPGRKNEICSPPSELWPGLI
jgi:hypothetical protein